MMTQDELAAAKAKLNEIDTEANAMRQSVHDAIEAARKMNDATRAGQAKLKALAAAREPIMVAIAQHEAEELAEAKRITIEKAKRDAAAKAAEEAALPKPATIEDLQKQIGDLQAALLAAKG